MSGCILNNHGDFDSGLHSYGDSDQLPLPCSMICSCLRLGHKYQIDALIMGALRKLQYHFPATLAQIDNIPQNAAIELDNPADVYDLANILRDIGCYHLLPVVLFRCISGPGVFSKIVLGASRRDGSRSILSRENLLVCIPAWRSLFQQHCETSQKWRDIVDHGCTAITSCREPIAMILEEPIHEMVELGGLFRSWNSEWEPQMCNECVDSWKTRFELARRDAFNTLPCHFGLPGWNSLGEASAVRGILFRHSMTIESSFSTDVITVDGCGRTKF